MRGLGLPGFLPLNCVTPVAVRRWPLIALCALGCAAV